MRKVMCDCVEKFIRTDKNSALLLVDIGVWAFNKLLKDIPERARNIGIFEQGTVSIAAGLSLTGIVPVVYGINPFISQRALEQIKLDFVYQNLSGNFIVTGGSYEFSTLGYSHYCPEDVGTLKLLPGLEIVTPCNSKQFKILWENCHNNGKVTYFRLTDYPCNSDCDCRFGEASVIKVGAKCVVISVAETLDKVIEACKDEDVTILHYSTISPFDKIAIKKYYNTGKFLICTPFYKGTITSNTIEAVDGRCIQIAECGVPNVILRNYGTKDENDIFCGITVPKIREKLLDLIN